jgi:hypothetical protein
MHVLADDDDDDAPQLAQCFPDHTPIEVQAPGIPEFMFSSALHELAPVGGRPGCVAPGAAMDGQASRLTAREGGVIATTTRLAVRRCSTRNNECGGRDGQQAGEACGQQPPGTAVAGMPPDKFQKATVEAIAIADLTEDLSGRRYRAAKPLP